MKTILVAVDASPMGPQVLKTAVDMAELWHAKLILFQAVSLPIELPAEIYARPQDQLPALLLKEAREDLEQLKSQIKSDVTIETKVAIGVPWQVICEVSTAENVDLIVIGSHGHHWYGRMLGSTASRVVNHADRSVLVVRTEEIKK